MAALRHAYSCRRGEGCSVFLVSNYTGDKKDIVASGLTKRKAAAMVRRFNEGLPLGGSGSKRKRRRTRTALGEMSKKDYVAIAGILCRNGAGRELIQEMSRYFTADNPRFNHSTFVAHAKCYVRK